MPRLMIPIACWDQMIAYVQSCLPEEACGVAGGAFEENSTRIDLILPVINQLHSPVRFRMEPAGQLTALQTIEQKGIELVAIFHSHPVGPQVPSQSDIVEFYYPGVLSIIISPSKEAYGWQVRAFQITNDQSVEIPVSRLAEDEETKRRMNFA